VLRNVNKNVVGRYIKCPFANHHPTGFIFGSTDFPCCKQGSTSNLPEAIWKVVAVRVAEELHGLKNSVALSRVCPLKITRKHVLDFYGSIVL